MNEALIPITCSGCKRTILRGFYKYKVTQEDPLAQRLYCPVCDTGFAFMDLSNVPDYEE